MKSRQRKLLKLLITESTYKPTRFFSEALSVSQKTIYNDVALLNSEMAPFQLHIRKAPRNGIYLEGESSAVAMFQKSFMEACDEDGVFYTPTKRRLEMIRSLMQDQDALTLVELESRFYVTIASLRSDIEYLHNFLKPYHINLYTNKFKIAWSGGESAIQKALKQFILNQVKNDNYDAMMSHDPLQSLLCMLFDAGVISMVKDTVNHLVETSKRNISDYYVRSITITLLIFITRILKQHHIQADEAKIEDISLLEPYMIAMEVCESYEKHFGIEFSKADIRYLSQQLFAHCFEPSIKGSRPSTQYNEIVDTMIRKMSKLIETDLNDDQKLRDSLLYHIPPMIYRLKRKIKITNPLLQQIKNQYMILFSLTWYVASMLEQQYNVLLDDDEISFLFIYFQVSLEKRHGIHFKNIIIVCPIGLATSELVFTRVRQLVSTRDNITTMNVNELYASDISNIDFVISTVTLDDIRPPIIYVSPLVNDDDMDRIAHMYTSINKRMSTLSPYASSSGLKLINFIREDFVFWNLHFKTKEECLDYLIKAYRDKGLVDVSFGRSIYEREEMGDTTLYTGVAIPHAMPNTVLQSTIAIVTLQDKIKWGVNDVNIVIVIAIAECDLDRIKDVLTELMNIVERNDIIQTMLHTEHKASLLQVLEETLR